MISLPSAAMSLTGSMEDWARAEAMAARTVDCMAGIGTSIVAAKATATAKTATADNRRATAAATAHGCRIPHS